MKKLLAAVMALCLLIAGTALAESAEPHEFETFTLLVGSGVKVETGTRANNEAWFSIYPFSPDGDESTNMNCTWSNNPTDLSTISATETIEQVASVLAGSGYKVSDSEVTEETDTEIGGRAARRITFRYNIDMTELGGSVTPMIQSQTVVNGSDGAYAFTATAYDDAGLQVCLGILDTLVWIK